MATSLLAHLSWPELLRRWSGEAIENGDDIGLTVKAAARASGWIGTPLVWDSALARLMTPDRLEHLLTAAREPAS